MTNQRKRWGDKSQRIEKLLMAKSIVRRSKRTGKKIRFIRSFQAIADKYDVSRELVRQIATDLGIRSMYRLRGSAGLGAGNGRAAR